MASQIQNNAESKGIYKADIYREFVRWSAIGTIEKHMAGITDQNEFAKAYGVNKDTLTRWKKRPDFNAAVKEQIDQWTKKRRPHIIDAIYRSAMKGNARSQKLWVDKFLGDFTFFEKGSKERQVHVHHSDIRFLIEGMPPEMQPKFYGYLAEINSTVRDLQKKGLYEFFVRGEVDRETTMLDEGEQEILDEAIRANKEELERIEKEKPPSGV